MIMNITELYQNCRLCPRECGVNRLKGETGFCGKSADITAARAALHMWEEPCISGKKGSGTVFFGGCNLKCVFCQNASVSQGGSGKIISEERLSQIFLELKAKGAENINLVTPTHFVPSVINAVRAARAKGLNIPVVYNCGGYERPETVRLLKDTVDIFLPDFKYGKNSVAALKYSSCANYFDMAAASLGEMVKEAGSPVFDRRGMLKSGVVVRHLVLPGFSEESKQIIKYLYGTYGYSILISIMNQYTPFASASLYPEINRAVTAEEYSRVVEFARDLGVENGYIQEGGTVSESFIPAFDGQGI